MPIEDLYWKSLLKFLFSKEQDTNAYSVAEPQIHRPGLAHSLKCMFLLGVRGELKRLFSLYIKEELARVDPLILCFRYIWRGR